MAAKAYRINDRRGQGTYAYESLGNNKLYQSATPTNDRQEIPNLNFDTERNISRYGHRQLRSIGRFIYANFAPVHGALLEQAELSVGHFIPQFIGKNKEWGLQAEQWLIDWHRIMDMRGWPYDSTSFLRGLIVGVRRDGDHFTLLTENEDGYPLVQVIGPHRIGSQFESTRVVGGPFDGAHICNGIIKDDWGRVIGYRIYADGYLTGDYVDVDARDGFLSGFPEYCDQDRFLSALASCACDWQDIHERRKFELIAQKLGSSIALIEKNEAGEPMPGQGVIARASASVTPDSETGIATEQYEGGIIRYIKANSGAALESLRLDRPSADAQAFEAAIIRGAFKGMEWDVDFSLDPSKVGGASMRVVVEKINRTIEKNQQLAEKVMRRVDGYAISKAIKLGLLPPNDEWYKWAYQGPARVTADAKYDDDIDRERLKMGGMTYRDWYAKRGLWWEDEVDQRIAEQKSIEQKCKDAGVDVNKVQMLTPNGNNNASPEPPVDTAQ